MTAIGIIGCGEVVRRMYARVLPGHGEYAVRYVNDHDPSRAAEVAAVLGATVEDIDDLVRLSDVVIVATPPATHAEIVERALMPEKIVICEKPFATTRSDAEHLVEAARSVNAHLCVGHFRRLFPQIELAQRLVAAGVIGVVDRVSASEGGRFTWDSASAYTHRDATGGVLWDTGSHTLDTLLFVTGLDQAAMRVLGNPVVSRDRPEPSHALQAVFAIGDSARRVDVRLRLSRTEALPNLVDLRGDRGAVRFSVSLDTRVRLDIDRRSVVLSAEHAYSDVLEPFDAQARRIIVGPDRALFDASRFVAQVGILEAVSNA